MKSEVQGQAVNVPDSACHVGSEDPLKFETDVVYTICLCVYTETRQDISTTGDTLWYIVMIVVVNWPFAWNYSLAFDSYFHWEDIHPWYEYYQKIYNAF